MMDYLDYLDHLTYDGSTMTQSEKSSGGHTMGYLYVYHTT
jgi:hypothetical protein